MTTPATATFTVTLPGPYADEWTVEQLQQDIAEAIGLNEHDVFVERQPAEPVSA